MAVALVWAARCVAASTRSAAEHIAGFFGTEGDYEKSYMPWDELMLRVMEEHPEMYGPSELVLEHELDPADQ